MRSHLPKRGGDAIVFRDGDLVRFDGTSKPIQGPSPEERSRWHAMLLHIAIHKGYKQGWARHKYKEKFDTWPPVPSHTVRPLEPLRRKC